MDNSEDEDFRDFLLYCEGSPEQRRAAARRLDERSVREGQMSPEEFNRIWA